MEKHYRLPKPEQSFPSSDYCFDKKGWIQTTEQTKPIIYFKGILTQSGKNPLLIKIKDCHNVTFD